MKLKQFIFALVAMLSSFAFTANAQVAKVGNTEYATIDEAIAAWNNNTTLTLLADVTLSDVVTLKSTEHHILDLGTYTMTAASGKNAIVIKACGTGDSERTAITIYADATNPGGINAGNKCVIYYNYADGGISGTDRPIIKIEGGVFTGATSTWGTAGIYTIGKESRKCATLNISGGTFNCSINGATKSKLIISGGVFNYSVGSTGDSTALRMITGGKFKTFGFMTNDNKSGKYNKFTIGTGMEKYDVGVYVDKDGYLCIGGPVITELSAQYPAKASNYSKWSSHLMQSSAAEHGLFYEDANMAIKKHGAANVTVWEKPAVTIPETLTGSVVEEIKNNTALKDYTPKNLPSGAELEIVLESVGKTIVYDVTPMANGAEVEPTEAITFRLPVPASVNATYAKVYHDGALMGIYAIEGNGNAKYVEVSSADFSEFAVEPITVYEVATYEALIDALANDGAIVKMTADITATATQSTGYGKAGIVVDAGDVLDGNGKTLTINGAGATWDCAIAMRGGEVKNLTIAGAMRGIFMPGANGDVVVDNCKFENVVYTFNSDAGSKDYTVTIKNTTLNGWTSFSAVHKSVTFESCTFGKGSGYAFCRPYQATTFTNCAFAEGYELDTKQTAENTLNFKDCTYNDEALSAENNAMFYNGGSVVIDGTTTDVNNYVAQIGETKYETLEAAFAAAAEGATITMLNDATPALTSQRAITKAATIDLGGKTMTLTEDDLYFGTTTFKNGTIVVDPSVKASTAVFWMFANQTLTFDNVKVVATGVTGTYLIGLDGGTGTAVNLVNGSSITIGNDATTALTAVICDNGTGNNVTIKNSEIAVNNIEGRFYLGGKDGAVVVENTDVDLNGVKEGFYLRAGQSLAVTGTTTVDITLNNTEGRYGINLTDLTATYTKAENATVNATLYEITPAAVIGAQKFATLQAAINAVQNGETITLRSDIEATSVIEIGKSMTINGNGHKVTSSATRVFRVTASNIEVKLDGVNMVSRTVMTYPNDIRGISIDPDLQNVKLTLNNSSVDFTDASACDWAYAVNVSGNGTGHTVTVNGGSYEGANVINAHGANNTIVVKGATLTSLYPNNDVYYGACIWVLQNQGSSVEATGNTFKGSNTIAFNLGAGTALTESGNTDNTTMCVAKIGAEYYTSLADAFAAGGEVKVLQNIVLAETAIVPAGKVVTLDLNGKKITGTDNATGSFALININPEAELTINGEGTIKLTATNNREWNAYSSVISNQRGKLTVNGGTIEHLGGTDMAYAIDNLTNTGAQNAETVINGGTIKSTYRAIRQFLNSTSAQNVLTVYGGTIEGANKSIWMQGANTNANPGALKVEAAAAIKGDVYLTTAAGTAEYPVRVSVAATALKDGAQVLTSNVPATYALDNVNGVWGNISVVAAINGKGYATLKAAIDAAQAGDVVTILAGTYAVPAMKAGITVEGAVNADGTPAVLLEGTLSGTLENLTMKNIHIKGGNAQRWAYAKGNLVFENVTFEGTSVYALHFDGITADANLTYKNCTIIGWAALGGSPASCVFEGCTIKGNGTYGLIRTYFDTTIKNCTFDVANVNTSDNYEDGIHAVEGANVVVNGCTNVNGDMKDIVNVHASSVVTVDDIVYKNVAKVGTEYYYTLAEAFTAVGDGAGKTVELIADVDLADAEWTPVTFNGVFDGKGHTISNLVVNGAGKSDQGFFAQTNNGEIKNVTFHNANVTGRLNVGVVAGTPYTSKYTNVKVTGHVEVNGMAYVGGVGGKNAYANWTDITVDVDAESYVKATSTENGNAYRTYVGGVIGFNGEGSHTFKNISSNIKVIGDVMDIGGIFGILHYGNNAENITFTGAVEALANAKEVGGIAGVWHNQQGQTVTITNAKSVGTVKIGDVSTTGSIVGGAYNADNKYEANSGSLIINGNEAWLPRKVTNKDELNAALAAAKEGDIIVMGADINYGTTQLAITKAITLDLGGKTLTTGNAYGGMSIKGNPTIKNGTIVHASNTAAIKVWNATAFENLVIDVQGKGDANKTIGGIVLQSGSTTQVGSIKNVTIKGAALTNGIETYNCGDAQANVIGSMENVTIDAKGTGLLISAPCGTATNCDIKGGVNGIEISIKGNYSASLDLVNSKVDGGVYAHDEHSSNPDIVNNGTLNFTADAATTGASAADVTLEIARAESEKVQGVLNYIMTNAQAKVNNVYYATLDAAINAAKAGDTVTVFEGTYAVPTMKAGITIVGKGNVLFEGTLSGTLENLTMKNIHIKGGNAQRWAYAKGNLVFENVTFEATSVYALHFDGITEGANLTYKDCTIIGWAAMSGSPASCVFDGCTIKGNGTYGLIRTYFNATIKDCTFDVANVNKTDVYQDGIHAVSGATVTVTDCTNANDGGNMKNLVNVAGTSIVVLDGVEIKNAAQAGGKDYATFAEALAAVQAGETLTLLADLNLSEILVLDKAITLDGNGKTLTSTAGRAINVSGADGVTIQNLTINASGERAINVIQNATNVTIEKVTATAANYTVNVASSAPNAVVAINNSTLNGLCTVNVAAAAAQVTIDNSTVNCNDNNTTVGESYAALSLNKDAVGGSIFATNSTINVTAGSDSEKGRNGAEGGTVSINGSIDDVAVMVAAIEYAGTDNYHAFATLKAAIEFAKEGDAITLIRNVTMDYNARDAYETQAQNVVINGNGKTLTLNQKNSDWASFGLANNSKLVLKNMTIEKTGYGDTNGAWNTHAIIFSCPVEMNGVTVNNSVAVQAGATLNNVTINEANGYYGLWINGNGQTVTVNGGAINATNGGRGIKIADEYIDAPAQVTLNVDGTVFNTAKKAAVLVSSTAGAKIDAANVNITNVAEDSENFVWVDEDWAQHFAKVEVTGDATVRAEGVAAFTAAITANGAVQAYYKTLAEAINAAEAGATVELLADVTLAGGYTDAAEGLRIEKEITLNGNNHTIDCGNFQKGIRVYNSSNVGDFNVNFNNVKVVNNVANGRCIDTRSGNINLKVNSSTLIATNGNSQPLTIGGNDPVHRVTLNGTTIDAGTSGYAVISFVSTNVDITGVNNSTISGYAAFYLKGDAKTTNLNLGQGVYTGTNNHAVESGLFGTVVLEGDNNVVNLMGTNATVKAVANNTAPQAAFLVLGDNNIIKVTKESAKIITEGNAYEAMVKADNAATTTFVDMGIERKLVAENGGYQFYSFEEAVRFTGNEGTIKIVNDFELADTWTIPAGKTVTLDLNGKTISQSKACTASYEMINNKGNLTITGNGKISFKDTSAGDPNFGWGSYTVRNEGNLVVENGTIEHLGEQAFGKHCIMALYQYCGSTTINGGTISTPNYRSARLWKGDMTINGGTFDGQVWVQAVDSTAKLTVNGGTFEPNGGDASAVFVTNNQYDVQFAVTNGTFNGKVGCSDAAKLANAITGGKFNAAAVAGTNVDLIAFGYEFGAADADGYQTVYNDESVLYIATLADLKAFRDEVNSGANYYAGVNVYLAADIDMAGENWVGIGSAAKDHGFMGNFDGQGYKIKNLTINNPTLDSEGYAYAGLFGVTEGTDKNNQNTIKNLTIENVTINTTGHIVSAAIAYPYYTIVDNVKVCGNIAINGGDYTAGVLAYTRRCVNASNLSIIGESNSFVKGNKVVGGVISDIQTNGGLVADYKNFSAEGITVSGAKCVGAISGIISAQNLDKATVKNVELNSQDGFAGIVAGRLGTASTVTNVSYENVTNATTLIGGGYDSAKAVQAKIGNTYYQTLEAALKAEGNEVELLAPVTIATGETRVIDLNGKTVVATDNATGSYAMITNKGDLTINGEGAIKLTATNDRDWNAYSSVISNTVGGKLTVNGGTIEHLGGTDMAYAIDNLTNGKGTYAETIINGGTVKSTYRAIRQFLNGTEAQNILTVNGGTIEGANKSIWMQGPNTSANPGALTIAAAAAVKGDVYLTTTAGTAQYPVSVYIAAAALKDGAQVLTSNVPGYYVVANVDGVWQKVDPVAAINGKGYATLAAAIAAVQAGDNTIKLLADCAENVTIAQVNGTNIVIDGDNKTYTGTITVKGDGVQNNMYNTETLTFQNINFVPASGKYAIDTQMRTYARNITVDNCTFKGNNDVYGIRARNAYNYTVTNTTAEGVYTFFNAQNVLTGLTVENVSVKCANVAFSGAYGFGVASFKNVTVESDSNGVKVNNPNGSALTFENCSIAAKTPVTFVESAGYAPALTAEFNGTNTMVVNNGGTYWFNIVEADGTDATFKAIVNDANLDMSNTAFAASVGNVYYSSLQKAIDAAVDGDEVVVARNIELNAEDAILASGNLKVMLNVVGKNIILDMNGKEISLNHQGTTDAERIYAVLSVEDGAGLTVTGEGSIDIDVNDETPKVAYMFLQRGSGYLVIENGNYHMDDTEDSMVYTTGDEVVTINGGTFILDKVGSRPNLTPWILNTKGNNERQIIVNGGTFNYDINHQYRPFEVFVPENLAVKANGNGTWTIVDAQAYVTELLGNYVNEPGDNEHKVGYATVAEAIAATNELGNTVTILAGEYTQNLNVNKAITVKGEVDAEGNNLVTFNGKLNITADGATVKNINVNNGGNSAGYINAKNVVVDGCQVVGGNGFRSCYTSGTVTFKNSVITGTTYGIHFDGSANGEIVIENCTITGWTSFASTITNVAISGTTFDEGNYNQLRFYQNAQLTNCTFNEKMNIDWNSSNKTAEFTNCSVEGDKDLTEIISLANIATKGLKVTVDGELICVAAKINNKYYLSLQAAIDAATEGQTVTIVSDLALTEGVTVAADKNIFIDLNGKTITGTPTEAKAYAVITNRGTLTIQGNGSVICDHQLAGSTGYAVNTITNCGSLTIDGATIENNSTASNQIGYAIDNNSTTANAKVTVVSGNVTVSGSNYYDGIRQFCNSTEKENWVVVNGGMVSSIWMQNPSDGATQNTKDVNGGVTIEGGEVTNLYLEPSANFEAAITAGHVGNVSYFQEDQEIKGRNLKEFVTGGTFGTRIAEDPFLAWGYQLTGDAAPYTVVKTGKRAEVTFIDGEFTEYTNENAIEVGKLTYQRRFSNAWTPLYVPFEIPVSELAADSLEVAYINGVRKSDYDEDGEFDNNGFNMELIMIHGGKGNANGVDKKLKANYPYFVRSKSGIANMDITLENVNLYAAEEKTYDCTTFLEKYEITGNCRKMTSDEFESDNYIVGTEGWAPIQDGSYLNPFRFYMTVTSREDGSPIIGITFMSISVRGEELPDGTTIIYDVEAENNSEDMIFDLSGRRVLKAEKGGIYIINGKKVLVK